jgi:hypothetical protein
MSQSRIYMASVCNNRQRNNSRGNQKHQSKWCTHMLRNGVMPERNTAVDPQRAHWLHASHCPSGLVKSLRLRWAEEPKRNWRQVHVVFAENRIRMLAVE